MFNFELNIPLIRKSLVTIGLHYIIFGQYSISIPPENIRKPEVLWCFQGVSKEISGMKWVDDLQRISPNVTVNNVVVKSWLSYYVAKVLRFLFRALPQALR